MLAKNVQPLRSSRHCALSLTTIASKLAPTGTGTGTGIVFGELMLSIVELTNEKMIVELFEYRASTVL